MADDTVRLEGFSESLRGSNSYCVASDSKAAKNFVKGKVAVLDGEFAHRGRKVLVFQSTQPVPRWLAQMGWDAAFHVREVQDLKLALTYIQHAVRPTRVVWAGADPVAAVMTSISRMDGITLMGLGEKAPTHPDWQMIFWSPDARQEEVESALQGRMGSVTGLRSILKELQASQVGLVWSSKGEAKKGALYWYDPADGVELTNIDPKEAAEVLMDVAVFLGR